MREPRQLGKPSAGAEGTKDSGRLEDLNPRQSRKVQGAGQLAASTGRRRWKSSAEGKPKVPAPEAPKDARFGVTRISVAGTAGRCWNRGNPGLIDRRNPKSEATGQLGAYSLGALKDARFGETRRSIAGKAGRCRSRGNLATHRQAQLES
jgi:hypothetical protein